MSNFFGNFCGKSATFRQLFGLILATKKLIIYNVRSKQTEIFTGVEGDGLVPIILCQYSGGKRYRYAEAYPKLDVQ